MKKQTDTDKDDLTRDEIVKEAMDNAIVALKEAMGILTKKEADNDIAGAILWVREAIDDIQEGIEELGSDAHVDHPDIPEEY